jgi:hypothetical protein
MWCFFLEARFHMCTIAPAIWSALAPSAGKMDPPLVLTDPLFFVVAEQRTMRGAGR